MSNVLYLVNDESKRHLKMIETIGCRWKD